MSVAPCQLCDSVGRCTLECDPSVTPAERKQVAGMVATIETGLTDLVRKRPPILTYEPENPVRIRHGE